MRLRHFFLPPFLSSLRAAKRRRRPSWKNDLLLVSLWKGFLFRLCKDALRGVYYISVFLTGEKVYFPQCETDKSNRCHFQFARLSFLSRRFHLPALKASFRPLRYCAVFLSLSLEFKQIAARRVSSAVLRNKCSISVNFQQMWGKMWLYVCAIQSTPE